MNGLNWDNLKEKKCPRCGSEMVLEHGGKQDMIVCTSTDDSTCRFAMDTKRFRDIVLHGTRKQRPTLNVKIKWQYLHDNKCPICASNLRDREGKGLFQNCPSAECGFTLSNRRLAEILADENHPANTYRQ